MVEQRIRDKYFEILKAYVSQPEEKLLFAASELGREMVLAGVPPEDIAEMHEGALRHLAQEIPDMSLLSAARFISAPLMELLMAYGLAFRERLEFRERTEEALRESEQFLQDVFDGIQDGLSVLDGDLNIIRVNTWMERMYASQAPLLGQKCYAAYQQRESPCSWCPSIPALKTGELHSEVVPYPSKESPAGWIDLTAFPLKDITGRIVGVIEHVKDITKRVRAEEEREKLLAQIRAQAKQMEQILTTVPEGVLLLDAARRVMLANPVAEKHLAVLAEAQAGDTLTRLGDRPLAELLTSPPTKGLWHEVKADGRTFEVIARPMENGPVPENWVLVIRDVTQEREVQHHLRQQERLAAVGQLAAGIAHDFNNIMSVIVLYTYMALREGLPPKTHERLETVSRQAYMATELIQQILDFSRRAVLERRPMDLTPFLKEVVNLLERTVPENIRISLNYGMDEYTVNADPTRMQQAIMNLALNARDAMPQGGKLRIELDRLRVESRQEPPLPEMEAGEWVRVRVTDTGNGIPPDVLPHIFEPFFTTKEVGKGTGLGLAQVYGIVNQHEGHIDVSTKMGEGTTFTIYLPVLQVQKVEQPSVAVKDAPQGQGETVLVVEDNAEMREAFADILELLNYQVMIAANGRDALDILEKYGDKIVLVLSDLVMPEMGGQALFHAMRQRGLTLPVVMLSGHPMENELKGLQEQGLAGWMLKPPNMEQLARLLARVMGGESE